MDVNIVKLKKYAQNCSVLYVEDDELIRTQTASFLNRFFPNVVQAEDGQIGLENYKEKKFDIVITDINMPNLNGIDMIKAIKKVNQEQIILVTSAHNDSKYLVELINAGVMHFALKPFDNKQFLYTLYKIAKELNFSKEKESLRKKFQLIINQVKVGIAVLKDNKIDIVNKAFLNIGDFDSVETLKLEMPNIGILFEKASHCISATTNGELIEELEKTKKEDHKVRIIKDSNTYEYQIEITKTEEDNSCILTFTDITAIHNSLNSDEHTKLPSKKFVIEKIELLKQLKSELNVIILSINHYESITQWYGKNKAKNLEIIFSETLKHIIAKYLPDTFIGYFGENKFVIIPNEDNIESFYKALKNINISSFEFFKNHDNSEIKFNPSISIKNEKLNTNKNLIEIEVDLINAFDLLN